MTVPTDAYYLSLDDPQTVTLSATRDGVEANDTVDYASRLANRTVQQLFGGIALQSNEQGWNVPAALLSNIGTLHPGDTLTHGTEVWHVRDVVQDVLRTQWILKCVLSRN